VLALSDIDSLPQPRDRSVAVAACRMTEGNDRHVRSAATASVRRVIVTYQSLSRLGQVVGELREKLFGMRDDAGNLDGDLVDMALDGLRTNVWMQYAAVDAAVRDWRDLAPSQGS
jgi:hypothetical protein